ncbi:MAG: hypothetical protein KDB96_08230 [Flavobacteriales bacterium]|nr:hypothetical protein [Flavobacteriales bacterium]MCB0784067.1 hypothetical protein [Flavobacteriales bacterium]MCB0809254.1 hypothetical protein [Flavobacteriales bacterium]MCB0812352.1 hypothetical protein [Flavobacteriales bacterium]
MINWQFFPRSTEPPLHLRQVVDVFVKHAEDIDSAIHTLPSNAVLSIVRAGLEELDFQVERSKSKIDKIKVPVLFGRNGMLEKSFDADGLNKATKTVIEIEAGRAVTNYQFLKDLFQACMMSNVEYLVVAVRNIYSSNKDFETMATFFDTLYASNRLQLPLKGVLAIGY